MYALLYRSIHNNVFQFRKRCPSFRQNVDRKLSTCSKCDQHLTHCGQMFSSPLFSCARMGKVSQTTNLTARQTSNVRLHPQPRAPVLREAGVSAARRRRVPLARELLPAVVVEVEHMGIAARSALVPGPAVPTEEDHTVVHTRRGVVRARRRHVRRYFRSVLSDAHLVRDEMNQVIVERVTCVLRHAW